MLQYLNMSCCIGRDGTLFDSECAFIYSDIMVKISQVTPVTIQNKSFGNTTNKNINKIGNIVKKYQCNTFNTI